MVAGRSDPQDVGVPDLHDHFARDAVAVPLELRAPQNQTGVPHVIGIDHLRQRIKQTVLGVGSGLLVERLVSNNLDVHGVMTRMGHRSC